LEQLRSKNISSARFRRQYSVDKFILDFYCPELKLGIEIDGDSHFQNDSELKDKFRTNFIEQKGIH
jgi:very-short-patch-repair endonuclease